MYDVIIIGAGVTGSAAARELSRFHAKICVLEKEEDVCCGTSKANSAIVHAGYDAENGSLMAELNVQGNRMMTQLAEELDIPFVRNGSLVVCTAEADRPALEALHERGVKNGVEGLRIVEREELVRMEPHISDQAQAALYAPTGGIICPFRLNIAMAENACENGVEFQFNTCVENVEKTEEGFRLRTDRGIYEARCVVNAAGVYADRFHNMVSGRKIRITPRKGEYYLLDRTAGDYVSRTVFTLPGRYGKGVLVSPTVHGNLIVGPTAHDIGDKEATNTTREGLDELAVKCAAAVKDVPLRQVITSFAGLRAHEDGHEFLIGEPDDAPGFVDCAGIESPGLTASPAIGRMAARIVRDRLGLTEKEDFIAVGHDVLRPDRLSVQERNDLIRRHPEYGTVICRCETVTEGEILDAIRRPLGARSLDGIKRRTRAGMGRCQAGFCSPRAMEILARELGTGMDRITKSGGDSRFIVGTDKDSL